MTPHVDTEADSVQDALTGDVPDETTRQGYHREIAYILCTCGERFTTRTDFEDHK